MHRWVCAGLIELIGGFCIAQNDLYVNTSDAQLLRIDASSCDADVIGTTSTPLQDIAFTSDGRLWGVYGNLLFEIDPSNANCTLVGAMPGLSTNSLVAWNNDTLIGDYLGWLWGIRVSDGYAWQIDEIGVGSSGDLTWYNGDLYMTTFLPDLVRISVNEDLTAVTDIVHVGNLPFGWGGWLGANTIVRQTTCGSLPVLMACVGTNVLEVSAVDASVELTCALAILGVSWGAASMFEFPGMEFTTTAAEIPNIFSPNGDGINDLLHPIPQERTAKWECDIYDRWGSKVARCVSKAWDGRTDAGLPCADGTYFIVARVIDDCARSVFVRMAVTLVR